MRTPLFALASLSVAFCFAQSTTNYDCAHATQVTVAPGNIPLTFVPSAVVGITSAVPAPAAGCGNQSSAYALWYSFTATSAKHWIRESSPHIFANTRIEAFSGTCGSLTSLGCANSNDAALALTGLSPGTTYLFRMLLTGTCNLGDCNAMVAVVSVPANDDCPGAVQLTVSAHQDDVRPNVEGSTLGATQSQVGCSVPAASNDDVWYRFTATESTHRFYSEGMSAEPLTTEWFSGSCGSLTNIVCNGAIANSLTPGQDYFIRQYTTSTDPSVSERTMMGLYTHSANDECANAVSMNVMELGGTPEPRALSSLLASSSTVPCGTNVADLWVTFQAPGSGVTVTSDVSQRYTLYSGTCGSLTCLFTEVNGTSYSFDNLVAGDNYYLKVGAVSLASATDTRIALYAAAQNDECIDAIDLDVQPGDVPNEYVYAVTYQATQSLPGCNNASDSDDDIWFRFVATDSVHLLYASPTFLSANLRMEVMSGTCGSLTTIQCAVINDKIAVNGLTAGTAYYVRLYCLSGNRAPLRVALMQGVANDDCPGALPLTFSDLADWSTRAAATSINATNGPASCASQRDVWYTFTAAHTTAAFKLAPGKAYSLELFSGGCGALASLACQSNVDRSGFGNLVPGAEYHLRISFIGSDPTIPLLFDRPANDDMAGAITLPTTSTTFAQEAHQAWTYAATRSYARMCGSQGYADDDVWFRFIATQTAHTIHVAAVNMQFAETALTGDLRIEAYRGYSPDSLGLDTTQLGCAAWTLPLTGLTVGDTIYFRTYTLLQGAGNICAFTADVKSGNNDEATGAQALPYGTDYSVVFNTTGATQSLPGANCSVTDFADDDIWFKFTANGQPARVVAGRETADLAIELFSGTPGNLVSVHCSDNILVLPDNLTTGATYYLRVYSWKNATPVSGRMGLFLSPSLVANTCVDTICLGPVLLANPGIEQGGNCWAIFPLLADGLNTYLAPDWLRLHNATSDSYSSCANYNAKENVPAQGGGSAVHDRYILSRNGKGMAGIYVKDNGSTSDYREYIQAPLTTPMVPGQPYLVSFHVANLPFNGQTSVNGLGALLTEGPVAQTNSDHISLPPQVMEMQVIASEQWVNICGVVVPDRPWDHITIGSFLTFDEYTYLGDPFNTANKGYYFIDDVVVAQVMDPGCITGIGDVPIEDPSTNNGKGDDLRVYPNPANDRVNIMCDADLLGKRGVIEVFDITGKKVHAEQVSSWPALRTVDIPSEWREGLYLVMLRIEGQAPRSARLVVKR